MNQKLIKALCRPELLVMGSISSAALKNPIRIPIHFSLRRVYSFPDSLRIIAQEIGKIIKRLEINRIAGGATAGIPLAAAVSLITKIPMVYVRDELIKKGSSRSSVEGLIKKGDKVALLDDVLGNGEHKNIFIKNIEAAGGEVTDSIVIMDCYTKGIEGREMLERQGVRSYYLITWTEWFKYMGKLGYLSKEFTNLMTEFIADPYGYQNKIEWWEKFEEIKKRQRNLFV